MKKNNIILLSVGGVILIGGVIFLLTKRKSSKAGGVDEIAEPTSKEFPSELPKVDLTKIVSKKEDEKKAKYSLMEKLGIAKSVIDATKKADQQSKIANVKYPTINVGKVNLPTTNANIQAINRLNPPKITSGGFVQKKTSGNVGGLGFVK